MSYIRTKNGIFKAVDLYNDGNYVGVYNKKAILAKSDKLAELCDEFVIEVKDKMPFVSSMFFINEKEQKEDIKALAEYYKGYKNLYGAIWTSKGLIYVAKINEDGELVLI